MRETVNEDVDYELDTENALCDITMHKHLAGFTSKDDAFGNTGVGAADPENLR